MGKCYELLVDGVIAQSFNSEEAVAADYLKFIGSITSEILLNIDDLEAEANRNGRTIIGHGFSGVGSIPLELANVPKVANK